MGQTFHSMNQSCIVMLIGKGCPNQGHQYWHSIFEQVMSSFVAPKCHLQTLVEYSRTLWKIHYKIMLYAIVSKARSSIWHSVDIVYSSRNDTTNTMYLWYSLIKLQGCNAGSSGWFLTTTLFGSKGQSKVSKSEALVPLRSARSFLRVFMGVI